MYYLKSNRHNTIIAMSEDLSVMEAKRDSIEVKIGPGKVRIVDATGLDLATQKPDPTPKQPETFEDYIKKNDSPTTNLI